MLSHSLANLQNLYQYDNILHPFLLQGSNLQRENDLDRLCCRSCRFNCIPVLNHSHPHFFGFLNHTMTVSSTKNMVLDLKTLCLQSKHFESLGGRRGLHHPFSKYARTRMVSGCHHLQIRLPGRCGGQRQKTALPLLTTMYTVYIIR